MKKKLYCRAGVLSVFLIMVALSALSYAAPQDDGVIRTGGSTTLLPVIATAASDFMDKYKTWDKAAAGLPPKEIKIYVMGGGSGFGVQSTVQGTSNIGLVSRELKEAEKKSLGPHNVVVVGKDAVAFAVNKGNPLVGKVKNLSRAQVADIFSGKISTYKEIDPSLPGDKIVLLVRDPGAGSSEMVQGMVMGKEQISKNALQLPSQGALLKKLETNRLSLAYISAGLLHGSDNLYGFAFEGEDPSEANIISGRYSLVRPLYMVVKEPQDPLIKRFIDYVLTEGQKAVKDNHYIPINNDAVKQRVKGRQG